MNNSRNPPEKQVAPHHLKMLRVDSAISDDVIAARGYYTITEPGQAKGLGFSQAQARNVDAAHPALIIPYHSPDGSNSVYCMRPDNPRCVDDKKKGRLADGTYSQKVFKYEMPKGSGNILDCSPGDLARLGDPAIPLVFTEGAKKADSLTSHLPGYVAINVNGIWGWRGSNATQGKTALADFEHVALNGRKVYLLFDSDVRDNDHVKAALRRFRSFLQSKDATVTPVLLPPADGQKTGIDDWFAAGHTAAELEQLFTFWEIFTPDLGGSGKRRNWTTEQIAELFADWGYRFAMNDMSEVVELNGDALNDTKMGIVEARIRDEQAPVEHAKNAITVLADKNRYHPIKSYFRGLEWDGQDWITLLASYFTDKEGMFYLWLRRWLVGAVAKVEGDGQHQNFMLVLDGVQDAGKSWLAQWICPIKQYFTESQLNPDDKDSLVRLMSNFVWEIGELGTVTRRVDREALKRFISMRKVTVRAAYGRLDTVKPAIASFIGTVNDEGGGFLNDPTGNRRYAVSTLTKIDWNYATEIELGQVWAQAFHLYQAGEPWELRGDEAKRRDEINLTYQTADPMEDMIPPMFDIDSAQADNDAWRLTAPEILEMLGLKPERANAMRLAAALKGLRLDKARQVWVDGKPVRFYHGIRRKLHNNHHNNLPNN